MKNKEQNITETKIDPTNTFVGVDALVSLPLIKVNEITHGDSLKLTGCVPAKADLILEDMPYNTTACDWDKEPIDLKRYWETRLELIKPTGVICLTASQPFASKLIASNYKMFKYEWIWEKTSCGSFQLAKIRPMKYHENILVFAKGKNTYNPIMQEASEASVERYGYNFNNIPARGLNHIASGHYKPDLDRDITKVYPRSVQRFKSIRNALHPTQKPVGLFEYLIRTYTNEGELVFDGFGGSGTTAIAAYRTKRDFIVIEKDKKYFEIASKRLYQERNPLSTFDEAS